MNNKKVVIVGGVAGGASTAARLRRMSEECDIIMFERGPYISFANCGLPYYIGGVIKQRDRLLVQTPESMRERYNVDVRIRTEVVAINREEKTVTTREVETGKEYTCSYDVLVLSPGAEPIRPPIPGVDLPGVYTLRSIPDTDAITAMVTEKKPAHAVVVGGGYIGLEMAEALRERDIEVTLVELADQVMGPIDKEMAAPLHQTLVAHGVTLRLETSVTALTREGETLHVRLSDGGTIPTGIVIMAIGVKPDVTLAREAGLAIGERGGIVTDAQMRTSDPAIFAIGDAVETTAFGHAFSAVIPLAGPANRQGRIVADVISGRDSTYRATQGTGICKVCDHTVGMVGLNEKQLRRQEIPYEKVYVHPASHAGYYPGAHTISLKLLFSPEDGRILGAQAVGIDGVDKRIDVLATAMRAGMTVYDLEHLELAYAPPYGSAKDPVNYAGFVATNMLRGDGHVCYVEEVLTPSDERLLLDVRTSEEIATGKIPGAYEIPIDSLRERTEELPRDKEIIAYCKVGLRGYLACRILAQQGFRCRNLTGGYITYRAMTASIPEPGQRGEEMDSTREITSDTGLDTPHGEDDSPTVAIEIDACGMQCPGPILSVKKALDSIEPGQCVCVRATDSGFAADIPAWCKSTGHTLEDLSSENGVYAARICKATDATEAVAACEINADTRRHKTMVVFSGDFDKAIAAFIIANGAVAMGSKVTLFFTFWGLNILRKSSHVSVKKTFLERMFGWMMPRGAKKLRLSKMHMGGMGTQMIKYIMRKKNVSSLEELIASAQSAGVRLVACTMSMDLMGIKKEELIEGVEEGGVALFLSKAEEGNMTLFV